MPPGSLENSLSSAMLRRRWPWWVWLGVGVGWFGSSSGPVRQIQPRSRGSKAYPQSFGSTEFRLERPQPRRDMTILRVARRDHHVSDFRVFVRWGSGRVDPKFRSFSDQNQVVRPRFYRFFLCFGPFSQITVWN